MIAGLARLGVEAHFRGKNDLEAAGRKIAGLGLYLDDAGALLFHASVLADLDVELMLAVLRIPGAKLEDKGLTRVRERITTVSEQSGRALTGDDLREGIAAGFTEALGVTLAGSSLDPAECARRTELMERRYATEDWLRQRTPGTDARGTAVLKTPEGIVRVYVGVHGDALSSVLVSGDFTTPPPGLLRLEAGLRWCRADRERIGEIAREMLDGDELGVEPEALAGTVWQAAELAVQRGVSAPARLEGSCYFPERRGGRRRMTRRAVIGNRGPCSPGEPRLGPHLLRQRARAALQVRALHAAVPLRRDQPAALL